MKELTEEGSRIRDFRYQVRLGVGMHFSQFIYFVLPFYTGLKVYAYLLSILIGAAFGHLVLFVVFICRKRFKQHQGIVGMLEDLMTLPFLSGKCWHQYSFNFNVAIAASIFVLIFSALVFTRGMYVADVGWVRFTSHYHWLFILPFSYGWLVMAYL